MNDDLSVVTILVFGSAAPSALVSIAAQNAGADVLPKFSSEILGIVGWRYLILLGLERFKAWSFGTGARVSYLRQFSPSFGVKF